jgi:peptidoglycan hydrolase CwlO-like protein
MRFIGSKLGTRISALCLSFILILLAAFPVQATDTIKDLEDKTSGLQSDLSKLKKELNALDKELNNILSQIEKTSESLEKTKEELALAMGEEDAQYDSMMLRIKYMYENGSSGLLEILFSSGSLAEFVARADMVSAITEYDRNMLKELQAIRQKVAAKEEQLQKDQKYLSSLQASLDQKEKDLKSKIKSTSADLSTYTTKLANAKREAEEAQTSAGQPVKPIAPSTASKPSDSYNGYYNGSTIVYDESDVILLAALLEAEAGTSNYEALLAVGSVVVNRMKNPRYGNTLYGVIYARGQFPPATNGTVARYIKRGTKPLCRQAARDALNGKNNIGGCLSFRSVSSGRDGIIVGGNVFF